MTSFTSSPIKRRNLLRFGAFAGFATALSPALRLGQAHAALSPVGCNENPIETSADALQALICGNERWATFTQVHPDEDELRRTLVLNPPAGNGQKPFAAIISCSDSRVPPELVFDQGIGDLFVARVAGNGVNKTGTLIESLYYGTEHLGALVLFVLGHSQCGAVTEAVEHPDSKFEFAKLIFPAVKLAKEIVEQMGGNPNDPTQVIPVTIEQNVLLGVKALREDHHLPPGLLIAGGVYFLETSQVKILIQ